MQMLGIEEVLGDEGHMAASLVPAGP